MVTGKTLGAPWPTEKGVYVCVCVGGVLLLRRDIEVIVQLPCAHSDTWTYTQEHRYIAAIKKEKGPNF